MSLQRKVSENNTVEWCQGWHSNLTCWLAHLAAAGRLDRAHSQPLACGSTDMPACFFAVATLLQIVSCVLVTQSSLVLLCL